MASHKAPTVQLPFEGGRLRKCRSIVAPLILTDEQMQRLMDTFKSEMRLGLSRDFQQREQTCLQMENTFVRSLLDGSEEGDYLALDLGSTNFRVLLCRMRGGKCESVSKNYNVPEEKLTGPANGVFDHLAASISKFLHEEGIAESRFPLGFTFSFPMVQKSLKKGILITWTKSFACPDGDGDDAVRLLEEALARRGDIKVDVVAIMNDTTGTLMAGSYLDPDCAVGLIMGSGCNAAYVEKVENVDKWEGPVEDPKQVVIDIEWGAFGDNGSLDFVRTEFDDEVDKNSNFKGSFKFEKFMGGYYIGDIVRLVLLKLTKEGLMLKDKALSRLSTWGSFHSKYISAVEKDTDADVSNTRHVLEELGLMDVATADDIRLVRYVCGAISIRAAQLVAANIAVLVRHMGRKATTVGIDGSVYRYHPRLHDILTAWIRQLAPDNPCKFILAEDGSGRGAAFVAAVAGRPEHASS